MVSSLRRLTAVMHVCVAMDLLSVRTPPPAAVNVRRISHSAILCIIHYKNMPMQYTENILVVKMKIFTRKNLIFFLILLKT